MGLVNLMSLHACLFPCFMPPHPGFPIMWEGCRNKSIKCQDEKRKLGANNG